MVLGNMDVGINTQNLVAILLVIFLSVVNIFGVKTGAAIQNVFTAAKVSALLGLALFGLALGRNAQALAANFGGKFLAQRWTGRAARGAGRRGRAHRPGGHADDPCRGPGRVAVFGRRLE